MAGLQDVKMWCLSTSGYWVLGDEGIVELQRGSQKSRSGGGRRGGRASFVTLFNSRILGWTCKGVLYMDLNMFTSISSVVKLVLVIWNVSRWNSQSVGQKMLTKRCRWILHMVVLGWEIFGKRTLLASS